MELKKLKDLVKFELKSIRGDEITGIVHIGKRAIPCDFNFDEELYPEDINLHVWYMAYLAGTSRNIKEFMKSISIDDIILPAEAVNKIWITANSFLCMFHDAGVTNEEIFHMVNYWEKFDKGVYSDGRKIVITN